jgi:hypothetical protein
VLDALLAPFISAADFCKDRAVVVMNGDQETLGVEAMHLHKAVFLVRSAVDDDEDKVVVLVELRSLRKLFGIFDCEWVKLEDVSQDLKVGVRRLVEIEPEEVATREQPLGSAAVEAELVASLTAGDVTNRRALLIWCYGGARGPDTRLARDRSHRERLPARRISANTTASLCSSSCAP